MARRSRWRRALLYVLATGVAATLGLSAVDWVRANRAVDLLADAAWIVALDDGIAPRDVVVPAAGSPYAPGSPQITELRSMATRLERLRSLTLSKGHKGALLGTVSGERRGLRISSYGGFFELEGYTFAVAPGDRETWDRLFAGAALPEANSLAASR